MTHIKDEKKIFMNGRIMTMDDERPTATTLVVKDGHIIDIGGDVLQNEHQDAVAIDLKGRHVLPGFIDSHNHLSIACMIPRWLDAGKMNDKGSLFDLIKGFVSKKEREEWVIIFPWKDVEDGGEKITREELDTICPENPLMLMHGTIHKIMVNSKALERMKIDETIQDPEYGWFLRDADGKLNGIIWERAIIPFIREILSIDLEEHCRLIEDRCGSLLELGITCVQDAAVTPAAEAAYRSLHEQGRLPVSILMMMHGETWLDNEIGERLNGARTGEGDELLRVGPIKVFADGGIFGTVAYAGQIGGKDYSTGMVRTDFERNVIEAMRKGFRVCIHSIGNVTTDSALSTLERARDLCPFPTEMRPRIDHMFLISQEQARRLSSLGGCSSIQPFCIRGAGKYRRSSFDGMQWLPYKLLDDNGVILSASSDDPGMASMGFVDPIKCAIMGAQMSDENSPYYYPDQALPFERWLWFYTAGAAYVGGLEKERGSLKVGLVADMVVMDGEMDPKNPPKVLETWKAGERVFAR